MPVFDNSGHSATINQTSRRHFSTNNSQFDPLDEIMSDEKLREYAHVNGKAIGQKYKDILALLKKLIIPRVG